MENAENTDQAKMKECYSADLKSYKRAVRSVRLKDGIKRDDRLLTILSDNPSSLYSFIKSSRNISTSKIEKLTVKDKVYLGDKVPDGFYDSVSALKTCDTNKLFAYEAIAEQFSNYENIRKLCEDKKSFSLFESKGS